MATAAARPKATQIKIVKSFHPQAAQGVGGVYSSMNDWGYSIPIGYTSGPLEGSVGVVSADITVGSAPRCQQNWSDLVGTPVGAISSGPRIVWKGLPTEECIAARTSALSRDPARS